MKKKILSIIAIMIFSISIVLAVNVDDRNKVLRNELATKIENKLASESEDYQELRIDETFDINKVYFEGMHSVYTSMDNLEDDFVFENRFVTAAIYNNVEIADVYYTVRDNKIINVKVILDESNLDKDVLLKEAIRQMPAIENKDEISLYIPNEQTVVAFTENIYKMFVLKDEYNRYADYIIEELDGAKTIERTEFFNLHKENKIKNNKEFVKSTTILEVILILLLAILSILAFLSYVLLNVDKINADKKVAKKAPVKKEGTVKKVSSKKEGTVAKTKKKTTTKKAK